MSNRRPQSPRQPPGRASGANVSQARNTAPYSMPPIRFRVTLRRSESEWRIELAGFLRLVAQGTEQAVYLGRMPVGSRVTWAGACWEIAS